SFPRVPPCSPLSLSTAAPPTHPYPRSLHDALPISPSPPRREVVLRAGAEPPRPTRRHRWSGSAPAPFRTPASPSFKAQRVCRPVGHSIFALRLDRGRVRSARQLRSRGGCVRAELL